MNMLKCLFFYIYIKKNFVATNFVSSLYLLGKMYLTLCSSGFYHDPNAGWYYSSKDGCKFEDGNYVLLGSNKVGLDF